jgi:hypothetical protein
LTNSQKYGIINTERKGKRKRKRYYTMKNIIIITLLLAAFIGVIGCVGTAESTYVRKGCEVVQVKGDEITVEDGAGYLWVFSGKGYAIGTHVDLVMNTNHTDGTVTDDYVMEVR